MWGRGTVVTAQYFSRFSWSAPFLFTPTLLFGRLFRIPPVGQRQIFIPSIFSFASSGASDKSMGFENVALFLGGGWRPFLSSSTSTGGSYCSRTKAPQLHDLERPNIDCPAEGWMGSAALHSGLDKTRGQGQVESCRPVNVRSIIQSTRRLSC